MLEKTVPRGNRSLHETKEGCAVCVARCPRICWPHCSPRPRPRQLLPPQHHAHGIEASEQTEPLVSPSPRNCDDGDAKPKSVGLCIEHRDTGGAATSPQPARTTTFASPQGTTTRKGNDEGDLYTELHWSRGPRSWVGRAREQYGPSAEESCLPRYRNTFLPKTTKPGISQEQNLYLSR
jgi:hypothetical protein